MDKMVLKSQQWLNATYGNRAGFGSVTEDGQTGWGTINGLIRAMQIELGIAEPVNNFGSGTRARFSNRWPQGLRRNSEKSNVHGIIQCALWCKGYPAVYGEITKEFTTEMASSIIQLKRDMGLSDRSSAIDVEIMMSLLSMKQFQLLSSYGGKATIRTIQQIINRDYKSYTGILPTDGLYGREMNTGLIQVLQYLEGFTSDQATGNFGSGTRSRLRTVNSGTSEWVWLASAALVCNGQTDRLTRTWTGAMTSEVREFQKRYALPVTGAVDKTTWMSLLTSKGDPDRPCIACDTRFEITDELARHLKADGYQIVGRYLSEPGQGDLAESEYFKALRTGELERIVAHGLQYFPIFQEYSTKLSHFTISAARRHAHEAQAAAERLGVPGTIIYFAVDYDATDPEVSSHILPYFRTLTETLRGGYGVGIYASRNICSRVAAAGYASGVFVSDMSTGFSGNLGFPIPEGWVFDQFDEISGYRGKWDLDRVAYSGAAAVCSSVVRGAAPVIPATKPTPPEQDPLVRWVQQVEREYEAEIQSGSTEVLYREFAGEFILGWLRKPEYWSNGKSAWLWKAYTPEALTPPGLVTARNICGEVCARQSVIKGVVARRDVAHLAATALGYLAWGVDSRQNAYGYGDFGGWALDLLQLWGYYDREAASEDLYAWTRAHLGSLDDGKGFGYDDALADADAWLIARLLLQNPGKHSLSEAMKSVFNDSEGERLRRFFNERFGGKADNLVDAFVPLSDGIDAFGWNIEAGPLNPLKQAAGTDTLPTGNQAEVLARAYAAFLDSRNS